MRLPVVTIVGRPNVGKSSLFNALLRRRLSIVEPTAGVTRDRVSEVCDLDEVYFELVDTGGYGVVDRDDLSVHVARQIEYAVNEADLILFVVDGRSGLNPLDRETARLLRRRRQPVQLLANKVDEPHLESEVGEFQRLGFGEPMPVSATSYNGLNRLRDFIRDHVADAAAPAPPEPVMRIALLGKRNAGKSTFINALAGEDRVIVSEIPGTTRDSVDVRFEKDDRTLVAIDTAGLRRQNKLADDVEFYAYTRAIRSIERADVVLMLIDAAVPVGQVDKRLAQQIVAAYKPCVIVVNKWDLAKGRAGSEDYETYLAKTLPELAHAPIALTTALTGRNVESAIDVATSLFNQSRARVGTGKLNQALTSILAQGVPPPKRGRKKPRFFYATQVATQPPTVVLFVNDPSAVTTNHERFLRNRLQDVLPFSEIPIRLVYRGRRGHAD